MKEVSLVVSLETTNEENDKPVDNWQTYPVSPDTECHLRASVSALTKEALFSGEASTGVVGTDMTVNESVEENVLAPARLNDWTCQ